MQRTATRVATSARNLQWIDQIWRRKLALMKRTRDHSSCAQEIKSLARQRWYQCSVIVSVREKVMTSTKVSAILEGTTSEVSLTSSTRSWGLHELLRGGKSESGLSAFLNRNGRIVLHVACVISGSWNLIFGWTRATLEICGLTRGLVASRLEPILEVIAA